MKPKTAAILAALDTKGDEAQFIAEIIQQRGHRTLLVDVGVLTDPRFAADVPAHEIAREGGAELVELRRGRDKAQAMEAMTRGAAEVAARLHAAKRLDGIISIGGTAGTAIGTSAMRA